MFKIVVWMCFLGLGLVYLYATLKEVFKDKSQKLSNRKTILKIVLALLYVAIPILFFTLAYFYGMAVFIPALVAWNPSWLLFGLMCLHGLVAIVVNLTKYDIYSDTKITWGKEASTLSLGGKQAYGMQAIVIASIFSAAVLVLVSAFYYLLAGQAVIIFVAGLIPMNLSTIISIIPDWLVFGVGAHLPPIVTLSGFLILLYSTIKSYAEKGLKNISMVWIIRSILVWMNICFILLSVAQVGLVAAILLLFVYTLLTFIPKLKKMNE